MGFLSPEKLLVVFVVIMVVIGPEKLPQVAKQMGKAMESLRTFHAKLDSEVREVVPNLPSTRQIARMRKSPASFITSLLDDDGRDRPVPDPGAPGAVSGSTTGDWPADPGAAAAATNGHVGATGEVPLGPVGLPEPEPVFGDPSMN